ncbi:MAG: DHH family phosphoesterase [Peptostreptococcaceae bacterium]|nr:DHH family phosphoesterase [Peptostreptococcaceae bacterium]
MNRNRFFKALVPDTKIYLWIIGILALVIFAYDKVYGILGLVLLVYLIYYNWTTSYKRKKKWTHYIESLSSEIDSASKYAILNLPVPLIILEFDGMVTWYNSKFSEVVKEKDLLERNIEEIIPGFKISEVLKEDTDSGRDIKFTIKGRLYQTLYNVVKADKDRYIVILYFIDRTELSKLTTKYEEEQTALVQIEVDDYDDVISSTEEGKRPLVIAEIDRRLNLWATRMNGIIKKQQTDKYVVFFDSRYLENQIAKKFDILDEIREIDQGNKIPVTLSIGASFRKGNFGQLEEDSVAALELALGRGGNQAVVKKDALFDFYGGKTKALEKRNKVKARVVSHALKQLLDQSSRVIIMGHKIPDMDSFGASIGVYRMALNRGKDAFIVMNGEEGNIEAIYDKFWNSKGYAFIKPQRAQEIFDDKTLLVVVDTHRPSFVQCPELLELTDRIVLIDHHRRGTEFIENTVLRYLEPYASSTSELVTEILQYIEDRMTLEKIEAEALMAGIMVDTKNFSLKTGVRTFEAASFLRRAGADTTDVRQLFKDDLELFVSRAEIVRKAEIIRDGIAISVCAECEGNIQLVIAQAADTLLNIKGINTSFVIGAKKDGQILISGRSLGDINVQVILEKLGGGGHLTVAGAQLEGIMPEEAREMLLASIDEYLEKEED